MKTKFEEFAQKNVLWQTTAPPVFLVWVSYITKKASMISVSYYTVVITG